MTADQNQQEFKIIPHSRPTLGRAEKQKVAEVIDSAHIARGERVQEFEQAFAERIGVAYGASTGSGTAALHLTLLAMGIGPRHEVIIPSYVCTALLNALNYVGATPVLADIDPETYNLDPQDVKSRLTRRTKAIIAPHLFGMPAAMDDLLAMNVPVIEDCAQAVGSTYRNKCAGAMGTAAIFSFYATKVMTTGEGGMVVSRSKKLIDRVKDLSEYDNKDRYKIRYNYKMTDIQAAVGLAQLDRLETLIRRRKNIAKQYDRAFRVCDLKLPVQDQGHIYFRYVIGLGTDAGPWIRKLAQKKVETARPVYRPIHRYLGLKGFHQTQKAWQESLSIPIYPSLSEKNVRRVTDAVISLCRETER